jgi:hypothetical protein
MYFFFLWLFFRILFPAYLAFNELRYRIPLDRRSIEPDAAIRRSAYSMMIDFNAAHFGIAKIPIVPITKNQDIESTGLEVIEFVQLQNCFDVLSLAYGNTYKTEEY